jgi:hypothetical protein
MCTSVGSLLRTTCSELLLHCSSPNTSQIVLTLFPPPPNTKHQTPNTKHQTRTQRTWLSSSLRGSYRGLPPTGSVLLLCRFAKTSLPVPPPQQSPPAARRRCSGGTRVRPAGKSSSASPGTASAAAAARGGAPLRHQEAAMTAPIQALRGADHRSQENLPTHGEWHVARRAIDMGWGRGCHSWKQTVVQVIRKRVRQSLSLSSHTLTGTQPRTQPHTQGPQPHTATQHLPPTAHNAQVKVTQLAPAVVTPQRRDAQAYRYQRLRSIKAEPPPLPPLSEGNGGDPMQRYPFALPSCLEVPDSGGGGGRGG